MLHTLKQLRSLVPYLVCARGLFAVLAFFIFSVTGFSATQFDFDGNSKADASVYRPLATSEWWLLFTPIPTFPFPAWLKTLHGMTGDKIVPADYDADGKADIGVYHPNGNWDVIPSLAPPFVVNWWSSDGTEIPLPADYIGNSDADLAYFRPVNGEWKIKDLSGSTATIPWGLPGDKPVPADYDGNGKTDIAVFRPSSAAWFIRLNGVFIVRFCGITTDTPVPADYDGDGSADLAVYRESSSTAVSSEWYVCSSSTGAVTKTLWGYLGDKPVPADYDGNGQTDIAIYRPTDPITPGPDGQWWVYPSGVFAVWGNPTDEPIPHAYIQ